MENGMFNKKTMVINGQEIETFEILGEMYEVSEKKEKKKIENALRETNINQMELIIELILKSNLKITLSENKETELNDLYLKSSKIRNVSDIIREEVVQIENLKEEEKKSMINKIDYLNAISLIVIEEKTDNKELIDNIEELELVLEDELEGYLSYEEEERRKMIKALYRYYILRSYKTVKGLEEEYVVNEEQKVGIFKDTFVRFVETEGEEIFYYLAGKEEVKNKLMRMFEEQYI